MDGWIQLEWDGDAGYLKIDSTQYSLKQMYWHYPSEHQIDSTRYIYSVINNIMLYIHKYIYKYTHTHTLHKDYFGSKFGSFKTESFYMKLIKL